MPFDPDADIESPLTWSAAMDNRTRVIGLRYVARCREILADLKAKSDGDSENLA